MNGATCLDHVNVYSCTCAAGYTGDRCETGRPLDKCNCLPTLISSHIIIIIIITVKLVLLSSFGTFVYFTVSTVIVLSMV